MQPLTAPTASPTEDLDEVLGRFHAWTKIRKKNDRIDGVREVSYDEALQSSRRRWQAHGTFPTASTKTKEPSRSSSKDDTIAPDTVTLSTGSKPAESASTPSAAPSFETILSEAVSRDISSGPLALVWPATGRAERQVSVSFRVAVSEQALIKARAAEAGLTVSAYLRQCALEVEKLRAQVHHTLAVIEQGQTPARSLSAGAPPVPLHAQNFFARLRQIIVGNPSRLRLRA